MLKEATRFTLENPHNCQEGEDEEELELKRIRGRREEQLKSRAKVTFFILHKNVGIAKCILEFWVESSSIPRLFLSITK